MQKLWRQLGRVAFWLFWPVSFVRLYFSRRTRVMIIYDDEVLLVQSWLGSGEWKLPGGGLHRGEDPLHGAIREVTEETGLTLQPDQLQFMYAGQSHIKGLPITYHCFAAELTKRPKLQRHKAEITYMRWQPLASIAFLPVTPDVREAVQAWLNR